MVFSSLEFLFFFLPATLLLYFISPMRYRNLGLFAVSIVFYGFGEIRYVALMMITLAFDYACGFFIYASKSPKRQKAVLIFSVTVNVLILVFFKYFDFIAAELSGLGLTVRPLGLALPVGISFYTFQCLSYVVDVYRENALCQKNFVSFGAYITMFPQLVAGPIVRYCEIAPSLESRRHTVAECIVGLRRFSAGLAKKVLLGNTAGAMWERFASAVTGERSTFGAYLGVVCFTLQIYFDFSGYSDMAIGLGHVFGFRLPENFNYPYTAKSATDFWRRWHITLSSFFREYVYIPLGGNRRGRVRTYLNLLAVWLLTGLWHGAARNFLVWGIYWFLLIASEKAFLARILEKTPKILRHAYSLTAIAFGWVIFAFDGSESYLSARMGLSYVEDMLGLSGVPLASASELYFFVRALPFFACAFVACTPLFRRAFYSLYEKSAACDVISALLCPASLVLCTAFLVGASYNPFLYFRF